ncbi:sigma factor-like helix-turn-helix DNA-binding protein [Velocimicrobium porci]|uniref:RNA polymerase sigma-70 region 4 domain-containing protein n=1 Tax=Velocimicrobium porci TaxID=2606634 RepID=A0A6L5Y163_9FIRM|nr:sigma factor-like helix-turn-helix DNA-binding protein [Velocimicrobium porci]MSS64587.1 hypothetical protein [Velocimicrobium porci]
MTREELKDYQRICNIIKRLEREIGNEEKREIEIVKGKVKSSMKEHPYIQNHVSVEMYEPVQMDKSSKKILKMKYERTKLVQKKQEIEKYIEDITDFQTKIIFRYKFIEGKTLQEIGELLGYTKGRISQKISEFIKD